MKIVQSLWSKPSFKKSELNDSDRNNGGWLEKKYNYMSWALSCLQFRKFYPEVELVTDEIGADLLINHLQLPYTSVQVVLDQLNGYHPDLWALGKIMAYRLQESPFLHADGDVYIWERFPSHIENSPLVAQNLEDNFPYYAETFKGIQAGLKYIPEVIKNDRIRNKGFRAVNAGLLGGTDISFFQEYTKQAIEFIDNNVHNIKNIDVGAFNTIFEQYLFYCLVEEERKNIEFYIFNINNGFESLVEFSSVPKRTKYIHPIGFYKKNKYIGENVAHRLRTDHPEYYYKILNLLKTYQI